MRELDCVISLSSVSEPSCSAQKILTSLCADNSVYETAYRTLSSMAEEVRTSDAAVSHHIGRKPRTCLTTSRQWDEDNLSIMDTRLDALTTLHSPSVPSTEDATMSDLTTSPLLVPSDPKTSSVPLPPGWRLLDERVGWKPAPIGVFVQCN
jgi:hypothetical protein